MDRNATFSREKRKKAARKSTKANTFERLMLRSVIPFFKLLVLEALFDELYLVDNGFRRAITISGLFADLSCKLGIIHERELCQNLVKASCVMHGVPGE